MVNGPGAGRKRKGRAAGFGPGTELDRGLAVTGCVPRVQVRRRVRRLVACVFIDLGEPTGLPVPLERRHDRGDQEGNDVQVVVGGGVRQGGDGGEGHPYGRWERRPADLPEFARIDAEYTVSG